MEYIFISASGLLCRALGVYIRLSVYLSSHLCVPCLSMSRCPHVHLSGWVSKCVWHYVWLSCPFFLNACCLLLHLSLPTCRKKESKGRRRRDGEKREVSCFDAVGDGALTGHKQQERELESRHRRYKEEEVWGGGGRTGAVSAPPPLSCLSLTFRCSSLRRDNRGGRGFFGSSALQEGGGAPLPLVKNRPSDRFRSVPSTRRRSIEIWERRIEAVWRSSTSASFSISVYVSRSSPHSTLTLSMDF